MDRATRSYEPNIALAAVKNVENLLLFVDDDLRETGLALRRIEAYLSRTLSTLESPALRREQVHALASEHQVLEHVDLLTETLEQLRRRLAKLAAQMKR
jgi:DNA-binding transcriptional MerR regulator